MISTAHDVSDRTLPVYFAFAPGATHGWSRERNYDRYLFGKLIEYFDRYLGVAGAETTNSVKIKGKKKK